MALRLKPIPRHQKKPTKAARTSRRTSTPTGAGAKVGASTGLGHLAGVRDDDYIVRQHYSDFERAPIFWIYVGYTDDSKRAWAVSWKGRTFYTHKVWCGALCESVRREKRSPHFYMRGEGYVQVNDDGSISIY